MANRHLSRSIVLQTLFEWDFNKYGKAAVRDIARHNLNEFAPEHGDEAYVYSLLEGVMTKKKSLDAVIIKAAPEWPLEKISPVDRNVLRIGLYELLYGDRNEVPPKVAINEAIELGKIFGGENSGKFINGVLGTVYREIGEPGKDDTSQKDPRKMPKEFLGGAVVYRRFSDGIKLALVHDVFGYWTLSKGHLEDEEDLVEGTKREIKEELGIDVKIVGKIGENEYTASDPEKGKVRKHVVYFLAQTESEELSLKKEGGLTEARWFHLSEIPDLKMYGDIVPLVTKGIKMILESQERKYAA